MAIENGNTTVMPVTPMGNGGGWGNGFGGDWAWIILLLLAFGGGWGNGFGGGYGNDIYPWMNQAEITAGGFQNAQLGNQLTAIESNLGDIQTQLCNSFANVEQGANARAMSNMQQMFSIQSALQNCCCENRAGLADVKYTLANEGCQTRATSTANTQAILDKLCQLEIDSKQDRINDLERQLTMANLAASQTAQTTQLIADNTAQTQYIVNRVAPYPIPAYTVANPNTAATA